MRGIDWTILRTWNDSQNSAFEELCCQLAALEPIPGREKFVRKGTPDAGVECYWTLVGGAEWAWQAKFFREPPSNSQWSDLDKSVDTALRKHPQLKKYYVCLPQDRADPRLDAAKHFMDRWEERVEKWSKLSAEREMVVEFAYWGDHEILERLSREEHRGRTYFWFERVAFSRRWFEQRIEEAVEAVGVRYTPKLNVDLPIARIFDGLLRNESFYERIEAKVRELKRRYDKLYLDSLVPVSPVSVEAIRSSLRSLFELTDHIRPDLTEPIDLGELRRKVGSAIQSLFNMNSAIERANASVSEGELLHRRNSSRRGEAHRYDTYAIDRLLDSLREIDSWSDSDEARLSNLPAMLLLGEAGAGKTHLLCDVARRVIESGGPAVLLLGGQILAGKPWSWITGLLDLGCTREEFLGALDAAAEASGHRALLVIDALNESDDKEFWVRHLATMVRMVSRFPRIAFVVSVRSSYEDFIVPAGLVPDRMLAIRHRGFAGREYEATRAFFDHFRLIRPSVPLLLPEFRNPLFLSLFCKGIASRPDRRVPSGLDGITSIFGHFVEDVNARLATPAALDFDARSFPVQRSIVALAREMAETGSRSVPRDRAQELVQEILPRENFERSLFRHLLSEGLLIENRAWTEAGRREVVQFGYERFGDHAVAKYLLDTHLDPVDPLASFAPLTPLGRYVASEMNAWSERGLLEAFSIQVPERTGLELVEIAPHAERYEPIRAAFVESLIWRRPGSIGERALNMVKEELSAEHEARCRILDVLIRIGTSPDHPLAAEYLHETLLAEEMPRRDGWWSVFLHEQWGENGAMTSLIDWAWLALDGERIDAGSRHRAGILLGWFLTCPNRFVRDRATKALVGLFDRQLDAFARLLKAFSTADDPYIQERLYAVAYGCALRVPDDGQLFALANEVFRLVFSNGAPPANILLRDYARGVVELALARGWSHPLSHLAQPPYGSEWDPRAPTEQELRVRAESTGERQLDIAGSIIISSIMGHGDFGLYVIGTNSRGLPWISIPLGQPIARSMRHRFRAFESSLTEDQSALWTEHRSLKSDLDLYERLSARTRSSDRDESEEEWFSPEAEQIEEEEKNEANHGGVDLRPQFSGLLDSLGLTRLFEEDCLARYKSGELMQLVESSEREFRELLSPEQLIEYDNVGKYADCQYQLDILDRFDLNLVQRWVANRVFELGWNHELHGRFDLYAVRDLGRDAHKAERIGKKYQWIAYYECLARIADNFHFSDPDGDGAPRYEGTWQLSYVRNIDPSWLRAVQPQEEGNSKTPSWFSEPTFDWEAVADDRAWLHTLADIPGPPGLIETKDESGVSWLTLDAHFAFRQESFSRDSAREYPYREIRCTLSSYLIRSGDVPELLAWAKDRELTSGPLSSSPETHSIFYGEIFRSRAFGSIETPYHGFDGWTKEAIAGCPVELYTTAVNYTWEGNNYDCSVDDTFQVRLPSRILYDAMNLSSRYEEGRYLDTGGMLVARDTGVDLAEPDALIIRRDSLAQALEKGGYSVIWIFTGEKHVMTDDHLDDEEYAGRLLLSGAFSIRDERIRGFVVPIYQNRRDTEPLGVVEYR